ncbi:MAG TPA: response regulator [Bryobacteraceae bacterium]|nr:response regulator [Bryobacteraceae bacterium]
MPPILIVEDSETQALKLRFLLEAEGWEVVRTATAEDALEDLNRSLPALIVADYHLPGLRGDELCQRVRMNIRTRDIPILMLTAEQGLGSELAGLDSGADNYVSKSVPSEILLLRVRALLRKGAQAAGIVTSMDSFRRASVLAIDDSATYLEYLAAVLEAEGYLVSKSSGAAEALALLEREVFDCVLVDLVMPAMDGIGVCHRMGELNRLQRESRGGDRQPAVVIMLTSSEGAEDMTRSLEAGADDFVGKSSDPAVLKARIRALLRRKFFQEENQRIVSELRSREIETVRSQAAREAELNEALRKACDDLRQSQDAAIQHERLRALGQMASGIAHDINNALAPVSLYVATLLEREPGLSTRARDYLEITQRAIEDVAHTVGRMRDFYRARGPELVLSPVDVNRIVRQVADLTRARWHDIPLERGIVIDLRLDLARNLAHASGIEAEMREALTNLVFNAVDAMPAGGTLMLRTSAASEDSGHIEIAVTDTGSGMDEQTRRQCLEPFFTTKGERGTGLGLAMVYGVVRRHSAEIDIESAPGAGTTVRLRFASSAASQIPVQEAPEIAPTSLRLLIVDDDPVVSKTLHQILEIEGHQVATAMGGQEAVNLFEAGSDRRDSFDVVITDLGMPHVDGTRVAAAVKTGSPATRVILLTGWGQKLMAEGNVPPHVDYVISKPPKLRDLRNALAQCAQQQV